MTWIIFYLEFTTFLLGRHPRAAKVIFPGGLIRQLDKPLKAAKLMLESPNYFLVNSQSLQIGRRFPTLNKFGLYFLLFFFSFYWVLTDIIVHLLNSSLLVLAKKEKNKERAYYIGKGYQVGHLPVIYAFRKNTFDESLVNMCYNP